ncbi:MAG: hypothetical protein GAK43_00992 [Stenotrophomonas maltophilia]|nr:MAG: hypothetical protein GAK43_00992 [Stenotrophomonas maltophilia]
MLALQYTHRLPADYDLARLHARVDRLGPQWDAREGLVLKAFLLRERGVAGAEGHQYASLYLWQRSEAARAFVSGEEFLQVVDSFGRPALESWLPLGLVHGPADQAVALYREEFLIPGEERDWARRITEQDQERARHDDVQLVWSVLSTDTWRHLRFTLSARALQPREGASGYRVLHLARPGLERHP